MKVCENLKIAMQRCMAALPIDDINDPSAVLRCTTAGRSLVLQQSLIILYTLIWMSEIAAPESIRALNPFPVCTVTVRQSETRSTV